MLGLNVESGGQVAGYVLQPHYEDRIVEGAVNGSQNSFVAERGANNNTKRRVSYGTVLEGGKLKLTFAPPERHGPPPLPWV